MSNYDAVTFRLENKMQAMCYTCCVSSFLHWDSGDTARTVWETERVKPHTRTQVSRWCEAVSNVTASVRSEAPWFPVIARHAVSLSAWVIKYFRHCIKLELWLQMSPISGHSGAWLQSDSCVVEMGGPQSWGCSNGSATKDTSWACRGPGLVPSAAAGVSDSGHRNSQIHTHTQAQL